ncbi:hypothetical protein V8F33_012362 [Rhypophila sp. PSN 637]
MSTSPEAVGSPDFRTLPLRKSCQSCNMAKLKCNGQRPQCTRCSRRGTQCLYAPSKPVGRPPRRSHLRTTTQPLSASAMRGLRPTYHRGASTPPGEDRQQPESTEAQEGICNQGNQYSPSRLSPLPSAQLDRSAHYQTSSEMAASFHPLDNGSKPSQDPTELYTDYAYFDFPTNPKRDKIADLDISLLDLVSGDEFQSTKSPFVDEAFSLLNWCLGNEPLDFDSSPIPTEIPEQSPATATLVPDNAWELPRFYGSAATNSNYKSPLACCPCLTTVINLLLHRSNMRKASSAETMHQNDGELEALMQKGLSMQQRCRFCLEDPLISMIWARITDEYITAVIALRHGK